MNKEYKEKKATTDKKRLKEYWEVGKGLQKVDGLQTSEFLNEIANGNINGDYGIDEAVSKVEQYYENDTDTTNETREADIVSARISRILANDSFTFSPIELRSYHKELFEDVLPSKWVGRWREQNISKSESVLNGATVMYAGANTIEETLAYDFNVEKRAKYRLPFTEESLLNLMNFTSSVWQIHPFREGNTRTIAVFTEKYLLNMGVPVNNDMFEKHSDYFRDALVRNEYQNLSQGISTDSKFLKMFFENLLIGGKHDLESFDLRCEKLFD